MKAIPGMILVLALCAAISGQQGEGGNACDIWEVVVTDNTCNSGGCASSTAFRIPYCFYFYLSCGIYDNCLGGYNCKVTATVYTYPGHDPLATVCQNWTSDPAVCGTDPSWSEIVLNQGEWYTLEVCFEACPHQTCSVCSGCYARGRLSVQHP